MSTKAAVYVRMSQATEEDTAGVDRQEEAARLMAEAKGWTVTKVYTDNDKSASSGKERPAFEELLKDIKAGKVDALVIFHLDRLARRMPDLMRVMEVGQPIGLPIASVHGVSIDLSDPTGVAVAQILTAIAGMEVGHKAKRQVARNAQDAKGGKPYWRRRPFGYELDGSLREEEAEAVRFAVTSVLQGDTLASIAREFNQRGLTTPISKAGKVGGNKWQTVNLRQLLNNERIAGLRTYQGTTVPGTWVPIVSEEDWRSVVAILKDPSRRSNNSNSGPTPQTLLTGIAQCPRCSATVQGMANSYRCPTGHFYRSKDACEDYVERRTVGLLVANGANDTLTGKEETPETTDLRKRVIELRASLTEWEDAALSIGPAEYTRIVTRIRKELAATEAAMMDADRAELFAGLVGSVSEWPEIAERWRSISLDRRRAVIAALWDKITLTRDAPVLEPSVDAQRIMEANGGKVPVVFLTGEPVRAVWPGDSTTKPVVKVVSVSTPEEVRDFAGPDLEEIVTDDN